MLAQPSTTSWCGIQHYNKSERPSRSTNQACNKQVRERDDTMLRLLVVTLLMMASAAAAWTTSSAVSSFGGSVLLLDRPTSASTTTPHSSSTISMKKGKPNVPPQMRGMYNKQQEMTAMREQMISSSKPGADGLPVFNLFVRTKKANVSCIVECTC